MRRCSARSRRPSSTRCTSPASRATRVPGWRRSKRGTYAGLIEKIPYLQDLGITAVELLPVFQFDAQDARRAWSTTGAIAPCRSSRPTRGTARARTRWAPSTSSATWSRRCIAPGIEVILDVVYNHTAEGDHARADAVLSRPGQQCLLHPGARPVALCRLHRHRQHAERQSPHRAPLDRRQPAVLGRGDARGWLPVRSGLDPLARRGRAGRWRIRPILWDIETDPVLAGTKLIAEAWDAAGLYQVGSFVGDSWKEWNGQFPGRRAQLPEGR